jgi:hypothetical protein
MATERNLKSSKLKYFKQLKSMISHENLNSSIYVVVGGILNIPSEINVEKNC